MKNDRRQTIDDRRTNDNFPTFSALVTSGPTYEPLDPVRFLGNRSSGKQGHAIAHALAEIGAKVTLVTGPVSLPDPPNMKVVRVQTAEQMHAACLQALPVDVAVCVAAVSDWRPKQASVKKIKKSGKPPVIELVENPDILKSIAQHPAKRPALVIGFAAETEYMQEHAARKRLAKGCDWIVANDVSGNQGFERDENSVCLIQQDTQEEWPLMSKNDIAERLTVRIIEALQQTT